MLYIYGKSKDMFTFFYRSDIFTRVYEQDKVRRVMTSIRATLESVLKNL